MGTFNDSIASSENDMLGRHNFAREIARCLLAYAKENQNTLTVSLTGEWGSGKSTLMSYVKGELNRREKGYKIRIIEFNPWMFYKEASIRESFLLHFALALNDFESGRTNLSKKLESFTKSFKWLKYVNSTAGNIQEGLEKLFESYAQDDSLYEIKEQINQILVKKKYKVFVLLDDIDRLTGDETLQLFQTISLLLNFSNVYFLIAYDKEIVISAIDKEFVGRGEAYLEKIIQVDYALPTISSDKFYELFLESLLEISNVYNLKLDIESIRKFWYYHSLSEYFTSIRDIKRFINALHFRLPAIANDIHLMDFILMEAVRIFDHKGYREFYKSYTSYLKKRSESHYVFTDDLNEQFKSATQELLKAILPQVRIVGTEFGQNEKRVSNPMYFDRYFTLLVASREMQEKDFVEFMERPERRPNILQQALKFESVQNLLLRLEDKNIAKHFPKYEYDLIQAVIAFGNDNKSFFNVEHKLISNVIVNLLVSSKENKKLVDQFFKDFTNQQSYPNPVFIYFAHYFRVMKIMSRNVGFSSEFDGYLLNNYEKVMINYARDLENSAGSVMIKSFGDDCPFIKFLLLVDLCEILPNEYNKYFPSLLKDKSYVVYLIKQLIWIDKNKKFAGLKDKYFRILIGQNRIVSFYDAASSFSLEYLEAEDLSYLETFLSLKVEEYQKMFENEDLEIR